MAGRTLIQSLLGKALSSDGSTTTARHSGVLSSSTADWSCLAWIYLASTPGSTLTIAKNGETGSGNGGWKFGITSASKLNLSDPGGAWGGTAASALSNTTWYHVGFIKASNVTQMYVNGVADGSTISGTFNNPQVDFTVGCTRNSSTGAYSARFNGYIDDVRVYTRAITVDELKLVYTQNQLRSASATSLVGLYNFDQSSGADSSGSSHDLTMTADTYVTGEQYVANIAPRTLRPTPYTYHYGRTVVLK